MTTGFLNEAAAEPFKRIFDQVKSAKITTSG